MMMSKGGPAFQSDGPARIAGLLMKFRADIYAYLLAAVRNHHDAEDLLQEVSLAATRSWERYEEGTNFRAWAREIARRRVLDYSKKLDRRAALLDPEVLSRLEAERAARILAQLEPAQARDVVLGISRLSRLEAAALEVEETQPADLRRDALRKCLEAVQGPSRRVLELRYDQRLDVPRIAAAVGRTVQATYAILKRVRQALRECADRRLSGAVS